MKILLNATFLIYCLQFNHTEIFPHLTLLMNHKIRVKWFFNNLVSTFIYLTIDSKLTSEFLLLYEKICFSTELSASSSVGPSTITKITFLAFDMSFHRLSCTTEGASNRYTIRFFIHFFFLAPQRQAAQIQVTKIIICLYILQADISVTRICC